MGGYQKGTELVFSLSEEFVFEPKSIGTLEFLETIVSFIETTLLGYLPFITQLVSRAVSVERGMSESAAVSLVLFPSPC